MSKGFVIMAQNSATTDYVSCAESLRSSIEQYMPNIPVTIVTEGEPSFATDWQVYNKSPYEHTIKLEADMIVTSNIDYWFDVLSLKDVVVCQTIRNYKGSVSNVKVYRNFIYDNNLPDVYNAMTYFKKSKFAEDFFNLTKEIFEHWEDYKKILKCDMEEQASTDWVYSIACHILGVENTTLPNFTDFSMVHMKQFVIDTHIEDWTKELVYELGNPFKVQTIPQRYPFHYHIKSFSNVLKEHYGRT